jgi:tRNA modification GTPase
VEAEGVARSRRVLAEADIVVYLVDATASADFAAADIPPGALVALNKIDALPAPLSELPAGWIPVSAATGEGFPALVAGIEKRIRARLDGSAAKHPVGEGLAPGGAPSSGEVHIASERQRLLLERAAASLALARADAEDGALDGLAVDLREAAEALGEISGEIATPEILETIFSRFCVGK